MIRSIIIINKLGDEFNFFSRLISENVDILYINNNNDNCDKEYLEKLVSLNLINTYRIKDIKTKDNHYCFKNMNTILKYTNKYEKVYTYGINNDSYKDDIIYFFSKINDKLYLQANNDYPHEICQLNENEYYLKYNLMLNLGLNTNYNIIETYVKYSEKDIAIYYKKKYNHEIYDYFKSTYIIDIQYAILSILKKYKLKKIVLCDMNKEMISPRVNYEGISILEKKDNQCDAVVCLKPVDIENVKYYISINCNLDERFKELEYIYINPVLEKLCKGDYKSNINYERLGAKITIYEKK